MVVSHRGRVAVPIISDVSAKGVGGGRAGVGRGGGGGAEEEEWE